MKNIIFLLVLGCFCQKVSCNADLLSKFHQNAYKIKDERIELISYDKNYINFFQIKVFKFNRTTVAHNSTINFKIDVGDEIEALVQGYKFLSNEYRHFPIRFQVNLRKSFDSNVMGLGAVTKCGNIKSFYFYKNITYTICNFVADEAYFPPLIPNGRYMAKVKYLFVNKEIALFHFYNEIYTPIVYPKK